MVQGRKTTRVVVFGAGAAGAVALDQLEAGEQPVCMADNDPDKIGRTCHGLTVVSPTRIPDMEFDLVLVAGLSANAMCQQLLDLGIAASRIEVLHNSLLLNRPTIPWAWLTAGLAAAMVALLLT
jgi:FlaA1/EpsC-like NDP-sugar epimerase